MTTNYEKMKILSKENMALLLSQILRQFLSQLAEKMTGRKDNFEELDLEITRTFYKWLEQEYQENEN